MGTHLIPRADVKGQDRLFIIFTVPGLIGTVVGIGIGFPFYAILSAFKAGFIGVIIMAVFGLVGFTIGQVKIPDTAAFPLFKKIGGESIKDIILRYMKFNKTKKKYVNELSSRQEFAIKDDKLDKIIMNKE
ncbi:MAG: hypothetical protein J6C46_04730 [Clostridia bacterium]|nr:hypothetical protein [Clostridia bacterium]